MAPTGEERNTDITLEAINAKLDALSEQVTALAQLAEEERRRR